jgi:hypothetical protein
MLKLEPQIPPIFTDFEEEVVEDHRANPFVAKLQGVANRNLLYL